MEIWSHTICYVMVTANILVLRQKDFSRMNIQTSFAHFPVAVTALEKGGTDIKNS